MKKNGDIEPSWRAKLDMIFGDSSWYEEFYKEDRQLTLFGDSKNLIKEYNAESITKYICGRLETIFSAVAPNPRILYNSKNSPLFLFCFAISNDKPSAIRLALKGAKYILDNN